MSKKDDYEKKAEELIIPLIKKNNFELVDTEYVREGGNYYRSEERRVGKECM